MNFEIIINKNVKISSGHILYAFAPESRAKFLKAGLNIQSEVLYELFDNGNISMQQVIDISRNLNK